MYKVELSRPAAKELETVFRADKKLYRRFVDALAAIAEEPEALGKPLHGGLKGLRSYRFGSYRILYQVLRARLIVVVVDLGHRREIYR